MSKNLIINIAYGEEGKIKNFREGDYVEDYYPCSESFKLAHQKFTSILSNLDSKILTLQNGEDMKLPDKVQNGPKEHKPSVIATELNGEAFAVSPEMSHRVKTAKFFRELEDALNYPGGPDYRYILYLNKKDKDLGYLPIYEWVVDRWMKLNYKCMDLIGVKNV